MPIHTFRNGPPINWATRWLGGMCPAGVLGGLPVRGPDYAAHPPLADCLTLPLVYPCPPAEPEAVLEAWQTAVSPHQTDPILLLRSPARARTLLLQAANVLAGETVAIPANANRALAEAVKQHGANPHFMPLTASLGFATLPPTAIRWAQPPAALPPGHLPDPDTWWLDYSQSVPLPASPTLAQAPAVTLYGLHLSQDETRSGAILLFRGERGQQLYRQIRPLLTHDDQPDPDRAAAQQQRLYGPDGLVQRQWEALREVRDGLREAAGLPLLPLTSATALPHTLAVQIPPQIEPATFAAYVQAENTPVTRLSDQYPIHYAALRAEGYGGAQQTAVHLARWLLIPVGPDYAHEEIQHSILGIVKAADYLGVRWYADPAQAADYACLMDEMYGPGHDAYRPIFTATALAPSAEPADQPFLFREATLADFDAVAALFEALHAYNAALDYKFALADGWRDRLYDHFRHAHQADSSLWLLAWAGESAANNGAAAQLPAGLLIMEAHHDSPLFRQRHWAELVALYVQPNYRGCGLGRQLVAQAHQWAAAAGFEQVQLYVTAHNKQAQTFYRGNGFCPVQEIWRLEITPDAPGERPFRATQTDQPDCGAGLLEPGHHHLALQNE